MFLSKKSLCILLSTCFLIFIGCTKSNPESTDLSIELSASKSKYASFEIMEIIPSTSVFTAGNVIANIGNDQLTMVTESNKALVLLPRLSDGLHEIKFQINTKSYTVKFQIENKVNLPASDIYFQSASQQILSSLSSLEQQMDSLLAAGVSSSELTLLAQDLSHYNQVLQEQTTAYNQLSAAEKADFAAFMAANKYLVDSLFVLNAPLAASVNSLRTVQQVEDHESNVNEAEKKFVEKVITTVAHIPFMKISFQLVAVPNPLFSVGAGVAATILTTSFILETVETATLGGRLVLKRIKPFLFLIPATNSFLNNQETQVDVNADYRNITSSDPDNRTQNNENGPVIQRISNYYKTLKSSYELLIGLLPSFLRPTYAIAPLPANSTAQKRAVFNEYIRISNCNNPNVTLTQVNQTDGSIKIKASTTLNGTQSFSYDIEYLNTDFTTNLKKTVNASVTSGSSCPNALGTYHIKNFLIGGNGSFDLAELILLADGTAKYRLFTETNYRTYTYTTAGCFINLENVFNCSLAGFIYNGNTSYSWTNSCSSVYSRHAFFKQ